MWFRMISAVPTGRPTVRAMSAPSPSWFRTPTSLGTRTTVSAPRHACVAGPDARHPVCRDGCTPLPKAAVNPATTAQGKNGAQQSPHHLETVAKLVIQRQKVSHVVKERPDTHVGGASRQFGQHPSLACVRRLRDGLADVVRSTVRPVQVKESAHAALPLGHRLKPRRRRHRRPHFRRLSRRHLSSSPTTDCRLAPNHKPRVLLNRRLLQFRSPCLGPLI
mmetsp:Transcript_16977/g.50097  ORF Transcript_16977/g.50097 Transcript_16977/m.50097 type:complete len:220 (-) Transcript_16977:4-663(-)